MIQILTVLSILFGVGQAAFIGFALSGKTPGFLQTDRAVFIAAFVLGLVLCSLGIQLSLRLGSFSRLGIISGTAIGLPLLVLAAGVVIGKLPGFLSSPGAALAVPGSLMMVKWILILVQSVPAALQGRGGI